MHQTPRISEGCTGILVSQNDGIESQNTTPKYELRGPPPRKPLRVTQEAVDAYERRSGFYGIGKKMVEHGRWVIVPQEERGQSPAPDHTNYVMMSRQRGLA
jgi:hypothetical protein